MDKITKEEFEKGLKVQHSIMKYALEKYGGYYVACMLHKNGTIRMYYENDNIGQYCHYMDDVITFDELNEWIKKENG